MMWATHAIAELQAGNTAQVRPKGQSMKGRVESGSLVTLEPCNPDELQVGDVVLVRVKGRVYLHLIKALREGQFQIGNNRGGINGWVGPNAIYGIATKVA